MGLLSLPRQGGRPCCRALFCPAPSQIYSLCLRCPESNQCPGLPERSDYLCWLDGWASGGLGWQPPAPGSPAPPRLPLPWPQHPPRGRVMGLGSVVEGTDRKGGGEVAAVLGAHLSGVRGLCGLPAPQLCSEMPSERTSPSSPGPPPTTPCPIFSVPCAQWRCNDYLHWFMCFLYKCFHVLCVHERGLWLVCVCVCA